jgi:CheY-like chemotaxis protein
MAAAALDSQTFTVLLVEDDEGDAVLIDEAFAERGLTRRLVVARDGVEALEVLRDPAQPVPDLILLDLNMPRLDGREVLSTIKADPALCHIPVVILTTSRAPADVMSSYVLHANAYVSKPTEFDAFMDRIRDIDDFYLGLVRLPSRS